MAPFYVQPEYNIEAQHNGIEYLAMNNTLIHRLLTRVALYTAAKLYSRDGLCIPISKHKIVKTGPYIVMERIQGEELPKVWQSLSKESIEATFSQSRRMFQELRSLTSPGNGVESCAGGHVDWHDLQQMMSRQDSPWPPPVFTHGDLNPFNVLVRGDKVVGIIDWEFFGWYPHYWEYTSAWFGNITRTEWQGMLDKILDRPGPEEAYGIAVSDIVTARKESYI
ncbi:hypothetical protein T440DRAFT_492908 [Plenodomus tracheiphilus IPT5]|uniref:Aminoglycoside phosphotransferase domain-containing protein n=1 Tax=Plenodomus tracheiphilus IPT5 TaxID=1408161 RepID=A0A6A7ATL3_9PLEO|nr:hypothetical protein T440DRAFT_492908 [Plenodomus tracheiphilus IPT5]